MVFVDPVLIEDLRCFSLYVNLHLKKLKNVFLNVGLKLISLRNSTFVLPDKKQCMNNWEVISPK